MAKIQPAETCNLVHGASGGIGNLGAGQGETGATTEFWQVFQSMTRDIFQ